MISPDLVARSMSCVTEREGPPRLRTGVSRRRLPPTTPPGSASAHGVTSASARSGGKSAACQPEPQAVSWWSSSVLPSPAGTTTDVTNYGRAASCRLTESSHSIRFLQLARRVGKGVSGRRHHLLELEPQRRESGFRLPRWTDRHFSGMRDTAKGTRRGLPDR